MKYLMTSATSDLGGRVLAQLRQLVEPADIVVTVRDMSKASYFERLGVTVRYADFTKPDTLTLALQGVDRMLLISSVPSKEHPRTIQHQNVIEAAKQNGISFIAYTSTTINTKAPSMLAPDHQFTERLLAESGIDYAVLRNNWYLENEIETLKLVRDTSQVGYLEGDGIGGWVLKRELAEAAARVLAGVAPKQTIYELANTPIHYSQLIKRAQTVCGKTSDTVALKQGAYREYLMDNHVPQEAVGMLEFTQKDMLTGSMIVEHSDLATILGHEPITLEASIKELLE